ncbi:MAG: hypothetical protein M1834_006412 [Cirrosporium novae-zelandiae]|nr:MAG: hypothetical protein M1834_006412 [Cirrosporium novae-zelandiae]
MNGEFRRGGVFDFKARRRAVSSAWKDGDLEGINAGQSDLQELHNDNTGPTKGSFYTTFVQLKKAQLRSCETESDIQTFYQYICNKNHDLEQLTDGRMSLPDQFLSVIFLEGLPVEFDSFKRKVQAEDVLARASLEQQQGKEPLQLSAIYEDAMLFWRIIRKKPLVSSEAIRSNYDLKNTPGIQQGHKRRRSTDCPSCKYCGRTNHLSESCGMQYATHRPVRW